MAARKSTTKTKKTTKSAVQVKDTKQKSKTTSVAEYLRFGESYTSLVLGIIAVIVATVLLLSFFSNRQGSKPGELAVPTIVDVEDLNITITPSPKPMEAKIGKTYTVASGDDLWKISEKAYGSGYNWVDIAKANKLADPSHIHVGDKLNLPAVTLKDATVATGENEAVVSRTEKVVDSSYTVVQGDTLWSVAVRAYGDGYQWTKIAKANNLTNPNIIHVGNTLKLPRN